MNEYPWSFKWIEHVLPLLSCFYGRHCAFDLWGSLREVGTIRRVFLSDWEMKWLICWKPETPKKNYWVQIMVRVITATRATLHQLFLKCVTFTRAGLTDTQWSERDFLTPHYVAEARILLKWRAGTTESLSPIDYTVLRCQAHFTCVLKLTCVVTRTTSPVIGRGSCGRVWTLIHSENSIYGLVL